MKLGDIKKIKAAIMEAPVEEVMNLHYVIFGLEARLSRRKLKEFEGFSLSEIELEDKIEEISDTFSVRELKSVIKLLGIKLQPKQDVTVELCNFLNRISPLETASDEEEDDEEDCNLKSQRMQSVPFPLRVVKENLRPFNGEDDYTIGEWVSDFEKMAFLMKWKGLVKLMCAKKSLKGLAERFIYCEQGLSTYSILKRALVEEFSLIDENEVVQAPLLVNSKQIAVREAEEVQKKSQENQSDDLERANRIEEIPELQQSFSDEQVEGKELQEDQETRRIAEFELGREKFVETRKRLVKMTQDRSEFLEKRERKRLENEVQQIKDGHPKEKIEEISCFTKTLCKLDEVEKLKENTGNAELDSKEDEILEDFDQEKYDKKLMNKLCNENLHNEAGVEVKPVCKRILDGINMNEVDWGDNCVQPVCLSDFINGESDFINKINMNEVDWGDNCVRVNKPKEHRRKRKRKKKNVKHRVSRYLWHSDTWICK